MMKGLLTAAAVAEAATGTPLVGMLTYSAAVTLYLAYVGFTSGSTGPLLWPAVVLHLILTGLLARAAMSRKESMN